MKKKIFLKYLFLACTSALVFTGCRKEPANDKAAKNAQTGISFIGFPTGMESSTFFDPFTDIKTVNVFTIKKDAFNNADLNKPENIVVTALPDAITAYNDAHDTQYELLPSSFYTVANSTADVTQATDGSLTFKFAPGNFAKDFAIKLNGSKLDLSKSYALAYKITKADGLTVHAANKDTLYAFYSVKNKYDGKYSITGTIFRNSATIPDATLSGALKDDLTTNVATIGANANTFSQYWATGEGIAGIDGLQLAVDPITNKVTVTASGNPVLKNTPGTDNYYDPATKTFHLAFDWGVAPNTRVAVTTLTYVSSR
ncbi:DUF1735 domain-containing protein [Mucilaginibacter lappiensis]|jgi:hypothetical protein|uniref:DUF1735 domain-containing protein n=1 Tax=Mucilaginibacter lappiensis TaxID=354630 RepID=UPI003D20D973